MYNNKRIFDILVSFISLLMFAVPFFIIALLIKKDNNGPIFYRQVRIGLNGQKFLIYKFRTMVENADKIGSHMTQMNDDPRVTKRGKWLRNNSFDELPQIINVFLGQMSIVGPRPDVPIQLKGYTSDNLRLNVHQGITGYAILAGRSLLNENQRVYWDNKYVTDFENFGHRVDIWVIMHTFSKILKKIGMN